MQPSTSTTLTDLAHAQCDVLTSAQLTACGLSRNAIAYRCGPRGGWQRPLPRVAVLHNGPPSWEQRYWAAVLYGGGGRRSAVTGRAALALFRLNAVPAPDEVPRIDVLVPRSIRASSRRAAWPRGEVRVLPTRRMPVTLRMNAGLPVAPLLRAVVDAARVGDGGGWEEAALYEAVQGRGVDPSLLAAELRAERCSGRPWVREVLDALGAGARSPAEALARKVLMRAGVAAALWNVRLYLDGRWLADPDAYWPRHGVLFEVDSATHHAPGTGRQGWERTMARHNRIEAAGLKVLDASPRQLRREPGAVVAVVREALAGGPYGPWEQVTVRPPR